MQSKSGRLHRHEECLGGPIRIGRDVPGSGIINNEYLIVHITEKGKAESPIPDRPIALWIEVEAEEYRITSVERQAVPVLFGRRSRITRAAHPTVSRQRVRGRRGVVGFDLGRRRPTL